MSFLGLSRASERYGVVIDIGSGSVLAAIVLSKKGQDHPQIIWSHREHAPLRKIESIEQSAKAVMTALVNASIILDTEGRKTLYEYDEKSKLTELQCSISAPWSYTITKTVNYKQDKPFVITSELIAELVITIQEKVEEDLKENEAINNLGLQIITKSTLDMLSNGYRVAKPEGQETSALTISHTSVVAQKYLIHEVDEMRDKLFMETECRKTSFIFMLFNISRQLLPKVYDVCLVDITYEATEIGVVRDGSLKYCTHTAFGSFSLAREISNITKVPLHEAFGYLHTDKPYEFIKSLNKVQAAEIAAVFEAYVERISLLFHETGDTLSIPRRISLHTDLKSESLFIDLIEKAAKQSLKTNVDITAMSSEIVRQNHEELTNKSNQQISNDSALLVSAQFFHNKWIDKSFEYF